MIEKYRFILKNIFTLAVTFAESKSFFMRILILGSYLCACCGALLIAVYLYLAIDNDKWMSEGILKSFLFVLPIFQAWYTWRTAKALSYPVFIATDSLDDFAVNEKDLGDVVISNHFMIKGMLTVCSATMAVTFYIMGNSIIFIMDTLFTHFSEKMSGGLDDKIGGIANLLVPIYFLSIIPAIIFNLRTYSVSRIVPGSSTII